MLFVGSHLFAIWTITYTRHTQTFFTSPLRLWKDSLRVEVGQYIFTKYNLILPFLRPSLVWKNSLNFLQESLYCHLTDYNPPLGSSGVLDSTPHSTPPPPPPPSLSNVLFLRPSGPDPAPAEMWENNENFSRNPLKPGQLFLFHNLKTSLSHFLLSLQIWNMANIRKTLTPPLWVMVATCAIRRWRSPQTRIHPPPPPPALSSFSLFGLLISKGTSDQRCFIQSLIEILFESLSF